MKIGIDLGGSHIGVGVVQNGEIIYKIEKDLSENEKGNKNIIELIIKIVNEIIKQNNIKAENIERIGIACPGIVKKGIVRKAKNLEIEEVNFEKEIVKVYKNAEIEVKNDAKSAALAEREYGVLHGYDNSIMLTIGTGIGGAVFYNGKLLEGTKSDAFELGHIIINKNGKKCSCGSQGCFEACSSIGNLRKEIREVLGKEITGKELVELLKKVSKDEPLGIILEEYITNLAIGIANITNIFEPEIIALGGSIVFYEDIIIERLKEKLQTEEYIFNKNSIPIIAMAKLNNDAGMIGAVTKLD